MRCRRGAWHLVVGTAPSGERNGQQQQEIQELSVWTPPSFSLRFFACVGARRGLVHPLSGTAIGRRADTSDAIAHLQSLLATFGASHAVHGPEQPALVLAGRPVPPRAGAASPRDSALYGERMTDPGICAAVTAVTTRAAAQTYGLIHVYSQLVRDRQTISREVMHEYDAKFVNPRVNYARRDASTSTAEDEAEEALLRERGMSSRDAYGADAWQNIGGATPVRHGTPGSTSIRKSIGRNGRVSLGGPGY